MEPRREVGETSFPDGQAAETCLRQPAIPISHLGTVGLIIRRLSLQMHYYNSGQGCLCMLFGWTGGGGDDLSTHVAEEVLVHPLTADGMRDSMSPANQHGFPVSRSR